MVSDGPAQGVQHALQSPLRIVLEAHGVALTVGPACHAGDTVRARLAVGDLCPLIIAFGEGAIWILDELGVESDRRIERAVGIPRVEIGAAVAVHADRVAYFSIRNRLLGLSQILGRHFHQAPVVVELPVVAQRPVVRDAAAVLALEAPVQAPPWDLQIHRRVDEFATM